MELRTNKILCGDSLELMKRFPDDSIDLVITDPPFNISHERKSDRTKIEHRSVKRPSILSYDFGEWDKFESDKDFLGFTFNWVKECIRVLKPNGSFYSFFARQYISYLDKMVTDLGLKVRSHIVWHKTNPCPQIFKVGYMEACEFILYATGKGHIFNYKLGQQHNFIETPLCQGRERLNHPTQKPEKVIEVLIKYSSNEDDVVFDPFVGTGTTCVVAKKLGRKWVGIDIDPTYVEMAKKRISGIPERLTKYISVNGS